MATSSRKLSILVLTKMYFVDHLRSFGHRVITVGFNKDNFELFPEDIVTGTDAKENSAMLKGFDYFFTAGAHINEILAVLPKDFYPDCVLYLDDSNPILFVSGLETLPVPTVFFSVDAHLHGERHSLFAGIFDKCLVAQKDCVQQFLPYCSDSSWFPLWSRVKYDPKPMRDVDVCFRGGLNPKINPKRVEFIQQLSNLVRLESGGGAICEPFSRCKIAINQTIKGDLNFRVFEAMMGGALMVTPRIENGQRDLFVPGVHLVEYEDGNAQDAAQKIYYYLAHENERVSIAEAGRALVLSKHTEELRARQIEDILLHLKPTTRPQKYFCAAYHYILHHKVETWMLRRDDKSKVSLAAARDTIAASAVRRESMANNVFLANMLTVRALLLAQGYVDEAIDMVRQIWTDTRGSDTYAYVLIYSLLQTNHFSEAHAVASTINDNPEVAIETAKEQISLLEKTVQNQLQREIENSHFVNPEKMR